MQEEHLHTRAVCFAFTYLHLHLHLHPLHLTIERAPSHLQPMPPREYPLALLLMRKWFMMVVLRLGVGLNRLLLVTCMHSGGDIHVQRKCVVSMSRALLLV